MTLVGMSVSLIAIAILASQHKLEVASYIDDQSGRRSRHLRL